VGQLVIALLAAAYFILGPLVLAVGTAVIGTLTILAGTFSVGAQLATGLLAGPATASGRLRRRGLGWTVIAVGSALGVGAGVAAIVLGAAFLAATFVPYPALPY
jgi:hypothetical protein